MKKSCICTAKKNMNLCQPSAFSQIMVGLQVSPMFSQAQHVRVCHQIFASYAQQCLNKPCENLEITTLFFLSN